MIPTSRTGARAAISSTGACRTIRGAIRTSISIRVRTPTSTSTRWGRTANQAVKASMPTLVTGTSTTEVERTPSLAQGGFTLLEMLVVVFIIALLASAAILSLGATGKDSGLEKERDRLSSLMSYVRERGAILTLEYGIRCGPHGYRFVYFDNRTNQWQPETVDETLRLRKLPPGLNLNLIIEGHQIVLDDKNLAIPKTATTPAGGTLNSLGADMP